MTCFNGSPTPALILNCELMDNHALIKATCTGDEAAFKEIMERFRDSITSFLYRMLNDYGRAVELAQETFNRVYLSAERYQANYNFSTYIYRIASNLAISELRQRKRRRLVPTTSFLDKDGNRIEVELADARQKRPDEELIEGERRRAVARAIASLPAKYQVAVVLRDLEDKSYEEISTVLGVPEGTVKSRLNRARHLLKDKLKAYL